MTVRDRRRPACPEDLPVLTDVAISGDVARQRGLYFKATTTTTEQAGSEAEHYLAQRLKEAVREGLTDAMVRAARGATGAERPRSDERGKGRQ